MSPAKRFPVKAKINLAMDRFCFHPRYPYIQWSKAQSGIVRYSGAFGHVGNASHAQ